VTNNDVVSLGPRKTVLLTWTGSRVQETLVALFAAAGTDVTDEGIGLTFGVGEDAVREAVLACLESTPLPEAAAAKLPGRRRRKYYDILGDCMLDVSLARGRLDLDGAREVIRSVARRPR
jgi:hypothetical protein